MGAATSGGGRRRNEGGGELDRRELGKRMMRMVCTCAGAAALLLAAGMPGHALSGDAPWCAVVEIGSGEVEWDCHYQTVEQCAPNVIAGNRGFCSHNPYYVPPPVRGHARPSVRRHYRVN